MTARRIALVNMPWASTSRPSLAIGLLSSMAERAGWQVTSRYYNLIFGSIFGAAPYEAMAIERSLEALGEHFFAVDIFGKRALRSDAFLEAPAKPRPDGVTAVLEIGPDALMALRDLIVPSFLDDCVEDILKLEPDIVGLSCVFNQVMPSLALAHRIKQARPGIVTLLGGGSVHGAMGITYAKAFAGAIDHVFTGEADRTFPAFLDAFAAGRSVRGLPGTTVGGVLEKPAEPVTGLDDIPTPNYDAYFETRAAIESRGGSLAIHRDLPYESARGCWWGEKSHCTFCGLNTEGMVSRNKSTARVLEEMTELASRYRTNVLAAADNILVHSGYRDLLPKIADLKLDLRLFYEIKANVGRDDVHALRRAGVLWLQPGIESFSDHVLQLMRKGVSGAQNIQLLKWLQEFGITPYYNLLVAFPGEVDADYLEMIRLLPSLFHLAPPSGNGSQLVQVHRFSPFHHEPDRLGIRGMRPAGYYRNLIPPRVADPASYAYFFDRDIPKGEPVHRHQAALDRELARWNRSRHRLFASLGPGFIGVRRTDRRGEREIATLAGLEALVFLLADAQTSRERVARAVAERMPGMETGVDAVIDAQLTAGIMVETGKRLIGVVPFERPRTSADLAAWTARWLDGAARTA